MPSQTNRYYYLDMLRVLSMLAVVYLHTAAPALRQFENMALWHISNAVTSLCTIAVPIFFMISGALLLSSSKTKSPQQLLLHRLPRVMLPFIMWSGIAVFFSYFEASPTTAKNMALSFFGTPAITPYWFIYAIIPIYLLSPLLKVLVDGLSPLLWRYLIAVWFVFSSVIKTVRELLPPRYAQLLVEHPVYSLVMVGGFLGYFLLGYALSQWNRPVSKKILWLVASFDLVIIVLGTWVRSTRALEYSEQFKSYLSCYVVILSGAVFLLAKEYCNHPSKIQNVLRLLSSLSFCIYLVHPRVITLLHSYFMNQNFSFIWQQILFYGLTLILSIITTLILSSIRPLCWIFTGQNFENAINLQSLFSRKKRVSS